MHFLSANKKVPHKQLMRDNDKIYFWFIFFIVRNSHRLTIENYKKRIPIARENFEKSGFADRITLIPGDAAEVLKTLDGPYDFIFMDAAKGQYIHFLPEVLRLLDEHGVLITDNVLQDGDVIESHFVVERRNRTIHKRMREYLFELTHNPELLTSVVPLGDGIAITMKQQKTE